jgi:hypothetical protein
VNRLIDEPDLRRRMGARARAAALPFTIQRCADAYLQRYAGLCPNAAANRIY